MSPLLVPKIGLPERERTRADLCERAANIESPPQASKDRSWRRYVERLPASWRRSPPPSAVQRLGDAWLDEGRSAVLRVPSVVVPAEWNYLLNPAHTDFAEIDIGPKRSVQFDPRLVKR